MHHTALPTPTSQFRRKINKALNLAMHIPVGNITAILPPLAGENALRGRIRRHRRDGRVLYEREPARLVQPGTAPAAGGKKLVLERRVDDAQHGAVGDDKTDGDAEHGEEVGIVYRSL